LHAFDFRRREGLVDWLKAANYELFGEQRLGWAKSAGTSVLIFCAMGYAIGNPGFAAVMGLMNLIRGHRLSGRWPYPLSRVSRSNLAFIASLVDSTVYFLVTFIVMSVLIRSGLPQLKGFEADPARVRDLTLLPLAFIWSPLAQWLAATTPGSWKSFMKSGGWSVRHGLFSLTAVALIFATWYVIRRFGGSTSALNLSLVQVSLAAVVQGVYWLALRRHFTRADLI
jgi:hypothetical protein